MAKPLSSALLVAFIKTFSWHLDDHDLLEVQRWFNNLVSQTVKVGKDNHERVREVQRVE